MAQKGDIVKSDITFFVEWKELEWTLLETSSIILRSHWH